MRRTGLWVAATGIFAALIANSLRLAGAQTFNGYQGSGQVSGSSLAGTVPATAGGTGMSIGCGAPTTTCGPCTDPNVLAYWNADVGIAIGTGVSGWTDICGGYVASQATGGSQPTYSSNVVGIRHGVTTTAATASVLTAVGSGAFPAIAIPASWGAFVYSTGTPAATDYWVDFGTTAAQFSLTENTTQLPGCSNGGTNLGGNAGFQNRPILVTCSVANQFTAGDSTFGISASYAGVELNAITSVATGNSLGGISLMNEYNGAASRSPAGSLMSVIVWKSGHMATRLEVEAWRSFEVAYTGGI